MRKFLSLLLCLSALLCLTSCGVRCKIITPEDDLTTSFTETADPVFFITEEKRNGLLEKEIRSYLGDIYDETVSFTYEIQQTYYGTYQNKDAMFCWVNFVDDRGFSYLNGFIFQ